MLMSGSLNLSVVSGVVGAALRRPQLAASLSAYNEEQRRCGRRWIYLWGSMGVGLTPPRLCSAIRPKGRGLRFDPGYHAKAAAAQRYARQEAARGIGQPSGSAGPA